MEQVQSCPLCGAAEHRMALTAEDHTVSHESFTVQQCEACGFHFTSPRPRQAAIGQYYRSANYISHAAKAQGFKDRIYHAVRHRAIRNKHALIAKHQPTGRALDVGCGTGDFLSYLQSQGYSTVGVEVSPEARTIALGKGVQVLPTLEEVPCEPTFQVITLWHVLEHVPDPRRTLEQLLERLVPGGLLVVAVPDHASWDCTHYGAKWAAWDVPRHLSHFRRKDVKQLYREIGIELIAVRHMWFDAPYVSMLSEQYQGAGPLSSLVKGAAFGLWSNAVALLGNRPTSSTLYLAKKPEGARKAENL